MAKRWHIPEGDSLAVARLVEALNIQPLTARVLVARGFTEPSAARDFMRPSLAQLHAPAMLTDMPQAIERLRAAIRDGESILIYGDYDVDGSTAVVLLLKAIELAGGRASFHIPHRLIDGYGMRTDVIERAAAENIQLIISVDTGIRATEVVRAARERGIDVIVTDHHLPENDLPPACAVVNPNRRDCTYPNKNLCGAGVAFKLAQALIETLDWPADKTDRMLRSFLKLVGIATVADVVPLTGENRIIVKFGLEGLNKVHNPGLRALLDVAGLGGGTAPNARQIAFQIAPRINAAGRMAHAGDVVRLFTATDMEAASEIAARLHSLNQDRQGTEAEIVQSALEECVRQPVTDSDAALVFTGRNWHRGVVGIVASRLVERFCRPVFVLSEEDDEAHGSGRSIPALHLLQALESMPELFTRFGGHRQAAGLSLPADRIAEFRTRLNQFASARLTVADFQPVTLTDARGGFDELTEAAITELLSLAPFGFGNPEPMLAVSGVEVAREPNSIKDKHLSVCLRHNRRVLTAKAWNFYSRREELSMGSVCDTAIAVEEDPFSASRGYPGWRIVLKDVRPCGMAQTVGTTNPNVSPIAK